MGLSQLALWHSTMANMWQGIAASVPVNSAAPRSAALAQFWQHFDAYFAPRGPVVLGTPPIANGGESHIQPVPFPQNPEAPNPAKPRYVAAQPGGVAFTTVESNAGPWGFTASASTGNISPQAVFNPSQGLIWTRGNPYE